MRIRPLDALFSPTRQAVLVETLVRQTPVYLNDLARRTGRSASSLQRDLNALVGADILHSRRDGNRVYYQPNFSCPFLFELRGLLTKTAGVVDVVRDALEPLAPQIDVAFIYGSVARGEEVSESDVDLMIVSDDVDLWGSSPAVDDAAAKLGRPVNPTTCSGEEFARRVANQDHFLCSVLEEPKLFVVGTEDELDGIVGGAAGDQAQAKAARVGAPPRRGGSLSR
jgi:predicted nucleotidyltransferase